MVQLVLTAQATVLVKRMTRRTSKLLHAGLSESSRHSQASSRLIHLSVEDRDRLGRPVTLALYFRVSSIIGARPMMIRMEMLNVMVSINTYPRLMPMLARPQTQILIPDWLRDV